MKWDPAQYARYADERGRPFVDLIARIGAESPRRVVDLGCGPGNLTALLPQRWPSAVIEGFDSSAEMITTAQAAGIDGVSFRVEDAAAWTVPADADVIVSNAVLQWVPGHRDLLDAWCASLPSGGWLAFQVPGNFSSPSHALMREVAALPRWRDQLAEVLRHHDTVAEPSEYAAQLLDAGLEVDAWETTYVHVLPGEDPVLEWVRGTGLRPVLAELSEDDTAEFVADYAARLRAAYPARPDGTLFPFRRVFAVGRKP
jgi:trans-aconitate 2-methyltransferase